MIYIGSGQIGELLSNSRLSDDSYNDILWGRRALNILMLNLKCVFRKKIIYLDTVDAWNNRARGKLWLWWLLSPYRIEKSLTYWMLVLLGKRVIRLHVPAIMDSIAWQCLKAGEAKRAMYVAGFTYESLIQFIEYVDSSSEVARSYSSLKMFELAKAEDINIRLLSVDPGVNAAKLLNGML